MASANDRSANRASAFVSFGFSAGFKLAALLTHRESSRARQSLTALASTTLSSVSTVADRLAAKQTSSRDSAVEYAEFEGSSHSPSPVSSSKGDAYIAVRTTQTIERETWRWETSGRVNNQGLPINVKKRTVSSELDSKTTRTNGLWLRDDRGLAEAANERAAAVPRFGFSFTNPAPELTPQRFDLRIDADAVSRSASGAQAHLWQKIGETFVPTPDHRTTVVVNNNNNNNNNTTTSSSSSSVDEQLPADRILGSRTVEEGIPAGRRMLAMGYAKLAPSSQSTAHGDELVLTDGFGVGARRGGGSADQPFVVAFGSWGDVMSRTTRRAEGFETATMGLNVLSFASGAVGVYLFAKTL